MFLQNRAGMANHASLGKYRVLKSKPPQTANVGGSLTFFHYMPKISSKSETLWYLCGS